MRNRKPDKSDVLASLNDDMSRKQKRGHAPKQTFKPGLSLWVVLVFTLGTFLDRTSYIPHIILQCMTLAGLAYLGYSLLVFRRWADENRYVVRFLVCLIAMIVELVVENFLVWYVSQTDKRKWEMVPGLQDNVEEVVLALETGKWGSWVKWAFRSKWCHVMHFLACLLGLAFSSIWDQISYSGFGLMSRATLTICFSRIIRTVSFLSTVLPSPRPGCFMRRFNYVPATWRDFWRTGFSALRGSGGCNDLIFSGHGSFWTIAPLAFKDYYPTSTTWVLWIGLFQASVRDVLESQHYSVDMVLAVAVTWLVWEKLEWVYPPSKPIPPRAAGFQRDPANPFVLALIAVCLFSVAYGVIISGA